MPFYQVELSDGRKFKVEADGQPSEEDIYGYLGQQPEESPSYLGQLGGALSRGFDQTVAGTRGTFNALTGDEEDLAANLATMGRVQQETVKAQTPADLALQQAYAKNAQEFKDAKGFWPSTKELLDYVGITVQNPGAAFKEAVQSAPNALVSIGTSLAGRTVGALAGAAAGVETGPGLIGTGIAGGVLGGAVANTLMESGPAIFDELNKRTGGQAANLNDEQIKAMLLADPTIVEEGIKTGAIRGGTIGLLEGLGLYGAGRVAAIPERAAMNAARQALVREGADLATREGIEAAMANPALRTVAENAAREAAQGFSTAGNVARTAAGAGIETAAAGAGEAAAQVAAGQEFDPTSVWQEMMGEVGLSPVGTLASKSLEAAGGMLPTGVEQPPSAATPPADENVRDFVPPDMAEEQRKADEQELAALKIRAAEAAQQQAPVMEAAMAALDTAEEGAQVAPETADALAELAEQVVAQSTDAAIDQALTPPLETEIPQAEPLPETPAAEAPAETQVTAEDQQFERTRTNDLLANAAAVLAGKAPVNAGVQKAIPKQGASTPSAEDFARAASARERYLKEKQANEAQTSPARELVGAAGDVDQGTATTRAGDPAQPSSFSSYLRTVTPTGKWTDSDYSAAESFAAGDASAISGLSKVKRNAIFREYYKFNPQAAQEQEAAEREENRKFGARNKERPSDAGTLADAVAKIDFVEPTVADVEAQVEPDVAPPAEIPAAPAGVGSALSAKEKKEAAKLVGSKEWDDVAEIMFKAQMASWLGGSKKFSGRIVDLFRVAMSGMKRSDLPQPLPGDIESASIQGRGTPNYADVAYMAAVEAGDMEAAQRMVDQAAKQAGFNIEAWHAGGVRDRFDPSFSGSGVTGVRSNHVYFASTEDAARYYEDEDKPVRKFWLKGPFREFSSGAPRANGDTAFIDAYQEGADTYPGSVTRNIMDGDRQADIYTLPYMAMDGDGRAKSGDPVVRDDAGNVIPLSQRFNQQSDDIRYSQDTQESGPFQGDPREALRDRLGIENFQNIVFGNYKPLSNGVRLRGFVRQGSDKVYLNLRENDDAEMLADTYLEESLHLVFSDPKVANEWARLKELVPADQLEAMRQNLEERLYRKEVIDEEAFNEIARTLGYEWLKQPAWKRFWEAVKAAVKRIFGLKDETEINRISAHLVNYAIKHQQEMAEDAAEQAESRGPVEPPFRASQEAGADTIFERLNEESPGSFDAYDKAKRRVAGSPPVSAPGTFTPPRFNSPDHFEAFANAAYDRGDYEAFLDAIKSSDAPTYRPMLKKLLRAAKNGDTDAADRAEWFRHVIAGTTPPNAKAQPKTKAASTSSAANQTVQQQPPPPPKTPQPQAGVSSKPRVTLNTAAMTWMARKLGASQRINTLLRRARGRFHPKSKLIDLHEQLFKDPEQAAKTLAHEIGHLLDHLPADAFGQQLVERLAPLGNYRKVFGPLFDWAGGLSNLQKVIKMEAVALSKEWRGDFDEKSDKYRASASELYADFISAFLNDPSWTTQKAPNITLAFLEAIEQKPEVASAYFNIVSIVRGGRLYKILAEERKKDQVAAVGKIITDSRARHRERSSLQRALWGVYGAIGGKYTSTSAKAGGYWANRRYRIDHFGTERDYVTQQEQAEMYGRRAISSFRNQMLNKVSRALVNKGIEPEYLDRLLRNQRIIQERTATGKYLEENPDEARDFLKWLVQTGSLGADVMQEVENASDADLYNLGAKIIRKLHEADSFEDVYNASQRVGAPPLAERGLFAFDVSGFMANPQGLTMESAAEDTKDIQDDLGAQRFSDLEDIAQDFYGLLRGVAEEANSLGLFKPEAWSERIEPNLDNYVPFMVLDYFTGNATASLIARKGTFKATLNSQNAGEFKASAIIARMQRQKQALILKRFFETEGVTHGFADEMTIIDDPKMDRSKADKIEREEDVAMVGFWDQGRFKWMKFKDPSVATAIKKFDPDDLNAFMSLLSKNANIWRMWVTVWSIGFQIRNTLRGVRTSWARLGVKNAKEAIGLVVKSIPAAMNYGGFKLRNLFRQDLMARARRGDFDFVKEMTLAAQYAWYVNEGAPPSPELQNLLDKGILTPRADFPTGGMTGDEMQQAILSGFISPTAMLGDSKEKKNWLDKSLRPIVMSAWDFMSFVSAIQESAPKISAYNTLQSRSDMADETRAAIARMEGIPNPGVGGNQNKWLEFIFLFWRVAVQGHRVTLNSAMNSKTRGGFILRTILSELAPKALYAMAAAGVADSLLRSMMGGDDEDEQVDMEEAYKRLSPYKIYKDDALPLFWLKPDGGIEWMFGHKSIPETWTPIAVRIPASEEGRWAGPASMFMMSKLFAPGLSPIDDQRFAKEWIGNFGPGLNPTFEYLGQYKAALFDSEPPRDSYRNRPIMPDDKWLDSGPFERMAGITKNLAAQAGVPFMAQGSYRNENMPGVLQALFSMPGLQTIAASDNWYGVYDEQRKRYEDKLASAAARNMRGDVTRDMVRRYENLQSKGDERRTELENDEYRELKSWYNNNYDAGGKQRRLMDDLRDAAKAKYSEAPEYERKLLEGVAKDSAKALEQSAVEVRSSLRALRES